MVQREGCCEVADEGFVKGRDETGPGWDTRLDDKAVAALFTPGQGTGRTRDCGEGEDTWARRVVAKGAKILGWSSPIRDLLVGRGFLEAVWGSCLWLFLSFLLQW